MEAGELRLGNWVSYGGAESWVTAIVDSLGSIYVDIVSYSELPIDELEGILFTQEWRQKFCLEMTVSYAVSPNDFYDVRESVNDDFEPIFILSKNNENIKEFEFVHELQNLWYALTGFEIETVKRSYQKNI